MIWPFKKPKKKMLLDFREKPLQDTESPDRDMLIRNVIGAISTETFPDNEHNAWLVRQIRHVGDLTYVMVEPNPKDVGYDGFVFLLKFVAGRSEPENLAVYCLKADQEYVLLCTAKSCPADIPDALTW